MINWLNKQEESWEGIFKSSFFRNDENQQDLSIYIEHSSIADYAEKCVESFNTLPESLINEICKGIIKCAEQGGINQGFELPKLENDLDILKYCWFTAVYVSMPDNEDSISYIVEGEGEWGEVIGFVIDNNRLAYIGADYFDYRDDEY